MFRFFGSFFFLPTPAVLPCCVCKPSETDCRITRDDFSSLNWFYFSCLSHVFIVCLSYMNYNMRELGGKKSRNHLKQVTTFILISLQDVGLIFENLLRSRRNKWEKCELFVFVGNKNRNFQVLRWDFKWMWIVDSFHFKIEKKKYHLYLSYGQESQKWIDSRNLDTFHHYRRNRQQSVGELCIVFYNSALKNEPELFEYINYSLFALFQFFTQQTCPFQLTPWRSDNWQCGSSVVTPALISGIGNFAWSQIREYLLSTQYQFQSAQ